MKKYSLMKRLSLAAASALALLAGTAPPAPAAPFDSPVGAWDFTLSGNAQGIAQITFNADGTIDGYVQLYTTKKAAEPNPRGSAEEAARQSDTSMTNSTPPVTNYFGSAGIEGRWSFDERGKIIGYLNEGNFTITSSSTNAATNHITFNGVVRLGTSPRVTLQGRGPVGKVTYTGIPDAPLLDIGGVYSATGNRGNSPTVEFFTLTSQGGNNNSYNVTAGSSPGFGFTGIALLSGRKLFSMVTTSQGTNGYYLTALVGSIKTNTATASLKGRENASGKVSLRMFPTPP
jgi:hypothetical protein